MSNTEIFPVPHAHATTAWLTGWSYRQAITVDNAGMTETLTNFPLYVSLDPTGNGDGIGGKIQDTGNDIRFTSSDGTTLLPYERESYAEASGDVTANLWVGVTLNADDDASTDDTIYVYYGNAGAADGKDLANGSNDVWDGNFKGVWHLSGATLSALDSTSNSNDGTNNGATAATGKVGNGGSFDGTDDRIAIPDSAGWDFGTGPFSISMWFKKIGESRGDIFNKKSADANDDLGLILEDTEKMDVYFKVDSSGEFAIQNGSAFSINQWHYATFSRDGSNNLTTYIDGSPDGSGTSALNMNNNSSDIWLGSNHDNSLNPSSVLNGLIDEVRISSSARSAGWISFEYANMNEADNQLAFAAEENIANDWTYRKAITIDHTYVDATLTDFPLLVRINQDVNLGANAQSDGEDIRFTASDGETILPYEREDWRVRSGSGSGDFWVKVPTISNTADTVIYLYYGNATAPDGNDPTNVWDSGFEGVWHMGDSASPALDSTANNNDVAQSGGVTFGAAGKVDGTTSYDGSDDRLSIADNDAFDVDYLTISAWVKADVNNKWQYIASKNSGTQQWDFGRDSDGKYYIAAWNSAGTLVADAHSAVTASTGTWEFVNYIYDGTTAKYYVNASAVISDDVTGVLRKGTSSFTIASQGTNNLWDGSIDELRLSSAARSAAWIKFEYYNMGETDAELSFGAQAAVNDATPPSVSTLSPADNATAVSVTANLVITFDEAVDPEAGAANDITIKKTSDNTTIETIDAQDAKVTGGGTTTITINPAATLNENTEYYVLIGADAFDDTAGNSYAGISSTTAWSFTTSDSTNPSIAYGGTTPADASTQNTTSATVATTTSDAGDGGVHSVVNDWNSSLKGWWRLNTSGDLSDSSGNSITATSNGATFTASGKLGGAYSFNGSSYLDMGIPTAVQAQNSITLSAWVKSSDVSAGYRDIIANQWNFQDSGIMLTTNGASTIHVPYSNGTVMDSLDATYTVADGNWHHLAVTFAAGIIKIYADGALQASKTSTTATSIGYNGSNHLLIGKDSGTGGTEYWNGSIDDVQIYSRALAVDEILALYDASANQYSHSFTGLSNGSSYTFKTYAQDLAGNAASVGPRTFSVDTAAPVISNTASSVTSSTATVTWDTDSLASSRVQYGTVQSFGSYTTETNTSPRVDSHTVTLSSLPVCTTYFYRVLSQDATNNAATGSTLSFTTSGCTNSATVSSQTGSTVTTSGGDLDMTNGGSGATLTVPADSSTNTFTLQIKKIDTDTVLASTSSPSGVSVIGDHTYDFRAISGSTLVTSFLQPITVVMEYTDAQMSGYDESTLWIYRWDGSNWNALSSCSVDTAANTVTCTTTHFSTFGLFGDRTTSGSNTPAVQSAGGRRGSPEAMAVRIAAAKRALIARFEGKKKESQKIAAEETVPAVTTLQENEDAATEREAEMEKRIAEREAEIARIEKTKKEFEEKFALHREERMANAAAQEEEKLTEATTALLAEKKALETEQAANAQRRAERLAERIKLDSKLHAGEVLAAAEREAEIAQRIAEQKAEIARIEKTKKEFEEKFALHREERMTDAALLEEQRLAEAQASLKAEEEALLAEQDANAARRDERLAEQDRMEREQMKASAPSPPASLQVLAARRDRFYAVVNETPVLYGDVVVSAWYAPYVSYVVEEKIATGYADETGKPKGEFGVGNPVTYAEVLKMALNAAGKETPSLPPPRNASAQGTWAASFVAQAESMSLSVFSPSLNVQSPATRGAVIQTILEVMGIPIANQNPTFTDVPADHPYARAIATATFYGLISGDTDEQGNALNTFRPGDSITRAEVAKIIALMKEVQK